MEGHEGAVWRYGGMAVWRKDARRSAVPPVRPLKTIRTSVSAYDFIDFPFPLGVIPAMSANSVRALPSIAPISVPAGEAGEPHLPTPHGLSRTPRRPLFGPIAHRIHGETRIDEYFWLRNREDPEVLAYLEAENRYTDAVMRPTEALQERLFSRRCGRGSRRPTSRCPSGSTAGSTTTAPRPGRSTRSTAAGRTAEGRPEEVLLDLNPLAEGHDYFRLGAFEVSPDHRLLACSVDTSGAEAFTLYVKDLPPAPCWPETIGNVSPSVAWANDSRTLFYVVLDEARRPCRLYRHRLGRQPVDDALVHFEADESFFLDVGRTRSHALSAARRCRATRPPKLRYASADRPASRSA